MGERLKPHPC